MAVALDPCSETFREFQINKWLGKFWNECFFSIALIGDRTSIEGSFLRNILGKNIEMRRAPVEDISNSLLDLDDLDDLDAHPSTECHLSDDHVSGVHVTVVRVPALSDASGYKDEGYFERVMDIVKSAQLVIYCINMSDTRLRGSVLRTFRKLKPDWSRTVIVLMFADALPALLRNRNNPDFPKDQCFNSKLAEWTEELKAMLQRIGIDQEVLAKITFYPSANEPGDLPNGESWLAPLSLAIMEILSPEKKAAFLKEHPLPVPTVTATSKQPATLSPAISTVEQLPVPLPADIVTKAQPSSESDFQASSASSVLSEDQSRSIRAALSKLRKDCPVFGILVIGRTGVGKSTLINNLLGKEVASVGHTLQSETPVVKPHEDSVEGVPIVVYDTPGLGDVKGDEDEKKHLRIMKVLLQSKKIHLVVYCFQMNQAIMTSSIVGTFRKYHKIGVDWERSVIAFTFADAIYVPKSKLTTSELFDKYVDICQEAVRTALIETVVVRSNEHARMCSCLQRLLCRQRSTSELDTVGVESDVLERLPICPTSLLPKDPLLNGNPWYVPLWLHIVEILSPAARVRFLDIHRSNICDEQTPPLSKRAKVEVKLVGEYKQQFAVTLAATVEAAGMDNIERSNLLATIMQASMGAIANLLNSTSEQSVPQSPQDTAGHTTATSATSPQNQTPSVKESILSQNVYEYQGHLMLLREHVSRKAAGKGRAVLEGLWLEAAVIEACFNNTLNEEEAVQAGIIKWIEGTGRRPPTWEILLTAMDFAKTGQQHVQNLKTDLGL